jgi:hypothetical protein
VALLGDESCFRSATRSVAFRGSASAEKKTRGSEQWLAGGADSRPGLLKLIYVDLPVILCDIAQVCCKLNVIIDAGPIRSNL